MKKSFLIVIVLLAILGGVCYYLSQAQIANNSRIEENAYYTNMLDKTVTGSDIATVINKVMDTNESNEVAVDENGYYEDNGENSIIVYINFKNSDTTFRGEQFFKTGVVTFVEYYSTANFKCTNIEFHESTKKVKNIHFEEMD